MKLNQVIAITIGKKAQAQKEVTKIYQKLGKLDQFMGLERVYRPIDEEGVRKPSEKKIVQNTCEKSIAGFLKTMSDMINYVATMDYGNTKAVARIEIDGEIIADDVPVTHLIFLEKKLIDIITFVQNLPELDISENWAYNENVGYYVSEPHETTSTSKVLKHKVLYEATKEHPAQIEKFTIDEIVGYWTTTLMSGSISVEQKKEILGKARKLQDAIKVAREEANSIEVNLIKTGDKILDYIFK